MEKGQRTAPDRPPEGRPARAGKDLQGANIAYFTPFAQDGPGALQPSQAVAGPTQGINGARYVHIGEIYKHGRITKATAGTVDK